MISLIAAMDRDRGIGFQGGIPWIVNGKNTLPADMKRFRERTTGHPVIMGRTTYESMPGPLKERSNIVLTTDTNYAREGVIVVHTLSDALSKAKELPGNDEIFILGGGTIYRQALEQNLVDRMYLTDIDFTFTVDAYFPEYDQTSWKITHETYILQDEKNAHTCRFLILEKP